MQTIKVDNLSDSQSFESLSTTKKKILIVDDDKDHLLLYKFLFNTINNEHEYMTFSSPRRALDYIKKIKNKKYQKIMNETDNIGLIISDYNMHPNNGIDFFKELKSSGITIPFVLFSSFMSDQIKQEARELGVIECIEKCASFDNTLSKISFYLM